MAITTKWWTWAQIWAKLQSQLDLENEDFIDEDEMMGYANDAIEECEKMIHGLNEDYFLTRATLTIVAGTDTNALPTSVYAHKIRNLVFFKTGEAYEIDRLPTLEKFLAYRSERVSVSGSRRLKYFIDNGTAGTPKILWTPVPTSEHAGVTVEVWHERNANRLEDSDDICDLPACVRYVFDFCEERTWFKRAAGSARHQSSIMRLKETRDTMVLTLREMVIDGNTEIPADFSAYEEHN
jgi:hypothetical protein